MAAATLLLGLRQLRAHVDENLAQHLLGLGGGDEVVDASNAAAPERRSKIPTAAVPRGTDASSRRCDASASAVSPSCRRQEILRREPEVLELSSASARTIGVLGEMPPYCPVHEWSFKC